MKRALAEKARGAGGIGFEVEGRFNTALTSGGGNANRSGKEGLTGIMSQRERGLKEEF